MEENTQTSNQQNITLPKEKIRIAVWMAWALMIVAFGVDLGEMFITWLGLGFVGGLLSNVLSFCATVMFYIWFAVLQVSTTSSPKKMASSIVTVIVENVPGFDAIPLLSWLWTIGVVFMIGFSRMEDKGKQPSFSGAIVEAFTFASPAGIVLTNTFGSVFKNRRAKRRIAELEKQMFTEKENGNVGQEVGANNGRVGNVKDINSKSFAPSETAKPSPQNLRSFKKAA